MGLGLEKEIKKIKNKYALLIGVCDFTDPQIHDLKGVLPDIENFSSILEDRQISDFEVTSLLNPKLLETRKEISIISRKAEKDDLIFLYYSGHGLLDSSKSLFLVFEDSESGFLDATCLDSEFILSQFRKSSCENFILIIDCCHSGAFFNNNRGLPKGLFALTACDEDQITTETISGGFFTNIIIDGLKSDYIDANRDGKITFSELFDYIIEETKRRSSKLGNPQKWEWNVANSITFFDSPRPVFISYKRTRLKFVKKLSGDLKSNEIPTFIDLEKIRIGDNWKNELEKTIKNSRVFLFVLDSDIIYSKVSMWELETAFNNNIPILPLEVEDVKLPAMFNSKYGHINRIKFNIVEYDEDVSTLIAHIKSLRIRKYDRENTHEKS